MEQAVQQTEWRRKDASFLLLPDDCRQHPGHVHFGRTHQQSGHREYRNNNGNDTRLRRHRNCHQPRPGVSERHRHRTGDTFGMNQ